MLHLCSYLLLWYRGFESTEQAGRIDEKRKTSLLHFGFL